MTTRISQASLVEPPRWDQNSYHQTQRATHIHPLPFTFLPENVQALFPCSYLRQSLPWRTGTCSLLNFQRLCVAISSPNRLSFSIYFHEHTNTLWYFSLQIDQKKKKKEGGSFNFISSSQVYAAPQPPWWLCCSKGCLQLLPLSPLILQFHGTHPYLAHLLLTPVYFFLLSSGNPIRNIPHVESEFLLLTGALDVQVQGSNDFVCHMHVIPQDVSWFFFF